MKQTGRSQAEYLAYLSQHDEQRIGDAPAQQVSQRDIRFGTHPGREVVARAGQRWKVVRSFMNDRCRWMLEYQYNDGQENTADRDRFLNSLRLLPSP